MNKWEILPTSRPPSPQMHSSSRLLLLRAIFMNLLCLVIGLTIGSHLTYTWFSNKSQYSYNKLPVKITNVSLATEKTASLLANNMDTQMRTPSATTSKDVPEDIVGYLRNTTRVLCWVMTQPDNHLTKAIHIRNTWGRRCNRLLFMSTEADKELGSIKLDVKEGREHLWDKTQSALKYIYDHHLDDAEWFLKADDDTYVIMENLRSFLYPYPPEAPVYFGCKFKRFIKQGYMSGGAGYVLSKTALVKFATEAYNNTKVCPQAYQAEDTQLGLCLQNVGVLAGDTRDEERKERFVPLSPEYIIPEDKSNWYKKIIFRRPNENATCCSPSAISFHYIDRDQFYIMDYLLYTLRPFGIYHKVKLPPKISVADVFSEALEYFYPLPSPPLPFSDDLLANSTAATDGGKLDTPEESKHLVMSSVAST